MTMGSLILPSTAGAHIQTLRRSERASEGTTTPLQNSMIQQPPLVMVDHETRRKKFKYQMSMKINSINQSSFFAESMRRRKVPPVPVVESLPGSGRDSSRRVDKHYRNYILGKMRDRNENKSAVLAWIR